MKKINYHYLIRCIYAKIDQESDIWDKIEYLPHEISKENNLEILEKEI